MGNADGRAFAASPCCACSPGAGAAALLPASTATPKGAWKATETQDAHVSIGEHTHWICLSLKQSLMI